MGLALMYGMGTAVPLLVGAWVGLRWTLPARVLAALMAFGAGTMIAAVSNDLFAPAFAETGPLVAAAALIIGAGGYVTANHLLEARLGAAALGPALLLGLVLDGIPENAALGVSLDGASTGLALLVAIAVGNVPEAVAGAAQMRDRPGPRGRPIVILWVGTAIVLAITVPVGSALASAIPAEGVSAVEAFAGGAVLAVLADSLMPEAYREGGWWVGIATALGFLVAFLLA